MPPTPVTPAGTAATTVDPRALIGTWRLERRMADRCTGQFGRVTGTLVVEADAAGASWQEEGTLHWGGRDLLARRRLALRRLDGTWWMTFADGSPFHAWQPGRPLVHLCRADTYAGLVDVDPAATEVRTVWDVVGPSKRQRIFSRYRRVGPE